jgi:enamine deaminase RidA (YjgF/YER057c/UK114 family)
MTDAHVIELEPDPYREFYISQGFRVGELVSLSGQVPITEAGAIIEATSTPRPMRRSAT